MIEDCRRNPRSAGVEFEEMGAQAARSGKPKSANPLREDSRAWVAWNVGWTIAAALAAQGREGEGV
jgi:hypothetical protein